MGPRARLAVLGAHGALGHASVEAALAAGHAVRALVRAARPDVLDPRVEVVEGDARDPAVLGRALEGCAAALHCLSAPLEAWGEALHPLLEGVIGACRATGARLVFPGNVWVYGPGRPGEVVDESRPPTPSSERGRIRAGLEAALGGASVRHAIVRLPEFFGPRVTNPLMGRPFRRALAGKRIRWLGGRIDVTVEYMFVRDAAQAMVEVAAAPDADGATFHVPGPYATTPRAFLDAIRREARVEAPLAAVPPWLLRTGALLDARAAAFADVLHLWTDPILLDGRRYRARFGAVPATPYGEAIRATLEWFRRHPEASGAA